MKVFGGNEFAARFPSAIAMTLTLVILAIVISRTIGVRRPLDDLHIGASALAIAAAKMCLTDSVLLLFVTTAQVCLGLMYGRKGNSVLPLPPGEGRGEGAFEDQDGLIVRSTPSP